MSGDRRWDELPEDCWELILTQLQQTHHHGHLESLSVVCKRFLSITNRLRSRLIITNATILVHGTTISRLLRRFSRIKRIDLVDHNENIDRVVREIANSGLSLEVLDLSNQRRIPLDSIKELGLKMRGSLRTLICSRLGFLQDTDLSVISDYFPYLEELDISYPENDFDSSDQDLSPFPGFVSDDGIAELSSSLRNLRRVNVSGNHFISDRSLISITSNCAFLSEIAARDCSFVSQDGIAMAIRNGLNLVFLSANGYKVNYNTNTDLSMTFRTLSSFHGNAFLRELDFHQMVVSDELLVSIAVANLPLKKLSLPSCQGFTFNGIQSILSVYQSLDYLDLEGVDFLTNQNIIDLSHYLHDLVFICLDYCCNLSNPAFFTLARACTFLEEIQMERTSIGKEEPFIITDAMKNPRIQVLGLSRNNHLGDTTLKQIASVCPKLKRLDLSSCCGITQEGLHDIGRNCREVVDLKLNGCRKINNIGMGSTFVKLEELDVGGLMINDESLVMIGKRCSGLVCLDLEGCLGVTERGVEEVVKSCKCLRKVNLSKCYNVRDEVLAWMVFSRTALRKIIPPRHFSPSEEQRTLFLRHGCLVSP